jgi:hypothetical protein
VASIRSLVIITHLHSSTVGYPHGGVERRRGVCPSLTTTARCFVVSRQHAWSVGVGGRVFADHGQPFVAVLGDEPRTLAGIRMREIAPSIEECALVLRSVAAAAGRHTGLIVVLHVGRRRRWRR